MDDFCPTCGHPHSDATTCEDALAQAIRDLGDFAGKKLLIDPAAGHSIEKLLGFLQKGLHKLAGRPAICRVCSATIYFVRSAETNKPSPYQANGLIHFKNCRSWARQKTSASSKADPEQQSMFEAPSVYPE